MGKVHSPAAGAEGSAAALPPEFWAQTLEHLELEALLEAASAPATIVNWCGDDVVTAEEWVALYGAHLGVEPKLARYELPGGQPGSAGDPTRRLSLTGPCTVDWRVGMVATLAARAAGIKKVAVFDFDVHHGNGTEAILHKQEGCAFFSIHQHPAYPGTGQKSFDNCRNYTVPPETPNDGWRKRAAAALAELK